MNRKRVDAGIQLAGQRVVDHAVTLDAALPLEGIRHDINSEVGLAARPMPGMSCVQVGFIDHVEALRRESPGQLLRNSAAGGHIAVPWDRTSAYPGNPVPEIRWEPGFPEKICAT